MNNKYQLISINKDYIDIDSFKIELTNRAFRYGDGFFETMHANGLDVQFLKSHYKRIKNSAEILKLELPKYFNIDFLQKQIEGLLVRNKLFQGVRVRLYIYRNSDGLYIPDSKKCDILIEASYLSDGYYRLNKKGLNIGVYDDMPKPITLYSSIKSINAQFYILAGVYAKENNYDDVLLLNNDNYIVEATSSNVFIVKDNTIITPSLVSGCVNGIMRNQIIDMANTLGYNVIFNNISLDSLNNADEVFLTNAVSGVRYVSGYKDKRFMKKTSSKLIDRLNTIFR